jgi:hypothetical protein
MRSRASPENLTSFAAIECYSFKEMLLFVVMTGLVPAIRLLSRLKGKKPWITGASPVMTLCAGSRIVLSSKRP